MNLKIPSTSDGIEREINMPIMISREDIANREKQYPAGTRIKLISMKDSHSPPKGTEGTVLGIDGKGSIMMTWDNGQGLSLLVSDKFRIMKKAKIKKEG